MAIDFDVPGAREAGFSDADIADYLAQKSGFNIEGAREAGFADVDIISHLTPKPKKAEKAAEPEKEKKKATIGDDFERGLLNARSDSQMLGAAVAGRNLSAIEESKAKADRGEYLSPFEREQARQYEEAKANTQRQFGETVAGAIDYRKKADDLPISPQYKAFKDAAGKGFGDAIKAFWSSPGEVLTSILAEGAVGSAPSMGAAMVGGLGAGAAVASGQAYLQAYAGKVTELLAKKGVDINDKDAVMAALSDPKVADDIRHDAALSAIPQAAAGAGGMLVAGKMMAPASLASRPVAQQAVNIPAQALTQGAIAAAGEAGSSAIIGEDIEGGRVGAAFVGGAAQGPLDATIFGLKHGIERARGSRIDTKAPEAAIEDAGKKVMEAPNLDDAMVLAREDLDTTISRIREFGTEDNQQQADTLQLFGRSMGSGEIQQDKTGNLFWVRGEDIVPLKPWDGQPGEGKISPELAAAQRDVYGKMGYDVVHVDSAVTPFDGAIDPNQPNKIFLSTSPEKNAAFVGSHEVGHLLETIELPDGTNLGTQFVEAVRRGVTDRGMEYARDRFLNSETAPKRDSFATGEEGDTAFAKAQTNYLIQELAADVHGEMPKFSSFMQKTVDQVQARYGADVAKDVLAKFLTGIRDAMGRLREMFFRPEEMAKDKVWETQSQHWLTNLEEVHDIGARLYAERFGTQAEKENAALRQMREKAQREWDLATFETPAEEVRASAVEQPVATEPTITGEPQPISGPRPGAMYAEAAQKVASYRRWLGELDEQRRADAAESPAAKDLQAKIDTILGKVRGNEDRLTNAAADRLEAYRTALQEIVDPVADSPDMARVRAAMAAEQARMADAAGVGSPSPGMERGVADAAGRGAYGRRGPRPRAPVEIRGRAVMPEPQAVAPLPEVTGRPVETAPVTQLQREQEAVRAMQERAQAPVEVAPVEVPPVEAAAPVAEAPPIVRPEPAVETPKTTAFDAAVAAERDTIWADPNMVGRLKPGLTRNEQWVTEVARERLMRRDNEDGLKWYLENGVPDDEVDNIARFYRPHDGETPAAALDRAVDRWVTMEEAKGQRFYGDEDFATYDWLKAETKSDPILEEAFTQLENHYRGRPLEYREENDIIPWPGGPEPTPTAASRRAENPREASQGPRGAEGRPELGDRGAVDRAADELGGEPLFSPREVNRAKETVSEVIDQALRSSEARPATPIAKVSGWLIAQAREVGLDLTGYSHAIDTSAVRHIFKQHGDEKQERARGQLPVSVRDIRAIPDILSSPDTVIFGAEGRRGQDVVGYVKRMEDGTTLYLEETRTRRDHLAALSLRRYPATTNVESIVSTVVSDARGDGGARIKVVDGPGLDKGGEASLRAASAPGYKTGTNSTGEAARVAVADDGVNIDLTEAKDKGPEFSPREKDTFPAEVASELSSVDEMFRYPKAKGRTPREAMREVAPDVRYMGDATRPDERQESGADRRMMFRTKDGSDVYLYERGDDVWLDLSRLKEGEGGSGVYSAAFEYAANTGRRLIGDPAGLSDVALRRRTDAMLSSALKRGSTDHMEPHPRQLEGDPALGVPPLKWQDGDTLGNIQRMIDVSFASLANKVPEVRDARYDFATRTFRTGEGQPLSDGTLRAWDIAASGGGEARIGRATLKRGILLNSLVRATGGERPGLLELVLRQPSQLVGDTAKGIFYSPRVKGTETYTPEEKAAAEAVRGAAEKSFLDRFEKLKDRPGTQALVQMVDPYAGLKERDPEGYIALRNANSTSGAQKALITQGTLGVDKDGTPIITKFNGGLKKVFDDLGKDVYRWADWIAANRAEQLTKEERERLYTPEQIKTLKGLIKGEMEADYTLSNGKTTRSREAAFLDALARYDEINKSVKDLGVNTGMVSRKVVDELWSNPFYLPFFRQAGEDGTTRFQGPTSSGGMTRQVLSQKLKGGTERLNEDLLENIEGNLRHMIDASIRNNAANIALKKAEADGIATRISEADYDHKLTKAEKAEVTWTMVDGKKQYWRVEDPLALTAIEAVHRAENSIPFIGILRGAKRLLQTGVAVSPFFQVKNLVRDGTNSIAISPLSYNVFKNLYSGMQQQDVKGALWDVVRAIGGNKPRERQISQDTAQAMAGGATMEFGSGTGNMFRSSYLDTPSKLGKFGEYFRNITDAYEQLSTTTENNLRLALYEQQIKQGKSHAEAAFAGRDLNDYTLRGASPVVRFFLESVPFLNPWMQGLYKLGRTATDKDINTRLRLAGMLATMAGLVAINDAFYADDKDYKARNEDDRNANFWFKFNGQEYHIPMGFEVAALARMATNWGEALYSEDMSAGRAWKNTLKIMGNTMGLDPTPQLIKPMLDLKANQSRTGAPIETTGMERLRPEYRVGANTTQLAKWLSEGLNKAWRGVKGPSGETLSPVQIDYLIQGYSAWLGTTAMQVVDEGLRAAAGQPEKPSRDWLSSFTGGMVSETPTSQRGATFYTNMLYEQGKAIQQAYATLNDLAKSGRTAEAREYMQDNRDLISKYPAYNKAIQTEGEINRQIRLITESETLSPEQKRVKIMALNAAKNRIAESVFRAVP